MCGNDIVLSDKNIYFTRCCHSILLVEYGKVEDYK